MVSKWHTLGLLLILLVNSQAHADSDHVLFDSLIKKHVRDGVVDYPAIQSNPNFDLYIEELSTLLNTPNREEQLAHWINAYNALAIKGIIDGRTPSTFFGRIGYFKQAKYLVGGTEINLYDLERKVIIPFGEPRIHFAINCASGSCPKLLSEIYRTNTLDTQLDYVTKNFIADASRNQFDQKNKIAHLSKIFDWFETDFKNHSGSVQKYIAQYVSDPILANELKNEEYKIKYLPYDWSLNGIEPR